MKKTYKIIPKVLSKVFAGPDDVSWILSQSSTPPDFTPDSTLLAYWDGTNTDATHKADIVNGYDLLIVTPESAEGAWDGVYQVPTEAALIAADALQNMAGDGPVLFDGSGDAVSTDFSMPELNNNKQLYGGLPCKGIAMYSVKNTAGNDAEALPWFFCDDLKGCDAQLTAGGASPELVTNGKFDEGTDDWNGVLTDLSVVDGQLNIAYVAPWYSASQELPIETGKRYRLEIDKISSNVHDLLMFSASLTDHISMVPLFGVAGHGNAGMPLGRNIFEFTAPSSHFLWIGTSLSSNQGTRIVDNITVREIESTVIKPSYFDEAEIAYFFWDSASPTIEMATGYTPTNPYMTLTIAGLRTVLAYDSVSNSYMATGEHTTEDLAIVNYLAANPAEVACVRMSSTPYRLLPITYLGEDITYEGAVITTNNTPI